MNNKRKMKKKKKGYNDQKKPGSRIVRNLEESPTKTEISQYYLSKEVSAAVLSLVYKLGGTLV
jgi:hypothetical protein